MMTGGRGVTLVEVIVALGIVVLISTVVFAGAADLSRRLAGGRERQVARWLLQTKLTEIEVDPLVPGHRSGHFPSEFALFRFAETIEPLVWNGRVIVGVYKVRLQVLWDAPDGLETLTAETCLAQHPDAVATGT